MNGTDPYQDNSTSLQGVLLGLAFDIFGLFALVVGLGATDALSITILLLLLPFVQLLWILPIVVYQFYKGRANAAYGVLSWAGFKLLLLGAYWGAAYLK